MPAVLCPRLRRQRGLSLLEAAVALAVLAVAAGGAAPAFTALAEQRQLQGVAAQFEADVHFARAAVELRSQPVRLSFHPAGDAPPRCWLVHTGAADACRCDADAGTAACDAPARLLRAHVLTPAVPVRLQTRAASLLFAAPRHTVTPAATLTLSTPGGLRMQEVVAITGRVRGCVAQGTVPGYRGC